MPGTFAQLVCHVAPTLRSSTPVFARNQRHARGALDQAAPMAKKKYEEEVEFGGPIGCAFIMLASHCLGVAMAVAVFGLDDLSVFTPTPYAFGLLVSFHALQMVLARVMPGVIIRGLSELDYNCNAYTSMFATLAVYVALHRMEARTAPRALACRARRAALGAAPCPRYLPCFGAATAHPRSDRGFHVARALNRLRPRGTQRRSHL